MIAVLSATNDDFYAMPLPFAVYSWWKIGVNCKVFIPDKRGGKLDLAMQYCTNNTEFFAFECEDFRIPTYSQVSRLTGATISYLKEDTVLITGDSDLCVFSDYFKQLEDGNVHIVGADLTPDEQYPMCFAAMPVKTWREVYGMKDKSYQEWLEETINPIQSSNLRGTAWCLDQFLLKQGLDKSGIEVIKHNRSNGQNQFALNRADRDSWYNFNPDDIIDAHLPRPLTDEANMNKVYELFKIKYPNDNLDWMWEYYHAYKQLL
jgi:hypothetical protein